MPHSGLKWEIAQTAARIMHQQRLQEYGIAKRKALESLSLAAREALPENKLVDEALKEQLALFASEADRNWSAALLQAARDASSFLADFSHYIGGSLASQTSKQDDRLEIHLYCDTPEALLWALQDNSIPYDESQRVIRVGRQIEKEFPCFSFVANNIAVSITVFPDTRPQARPCDTDGSPRPRLKPKQLAQVELTNG